MPSKTKGTGISGQTRCRRICTRNALTRGSSAPKSGRKTDEMTGESNLPFLFAFLVSRKDILNGRRSGHVTTATPPYSSFAFFRLTISRHVSLCAGTASSSLSLPEFLWAYLCSSKDSWPDCKGWAICLIYWKVAQNFVDVRKKLRTFSEGADQTSSYVKWRQPRYFDSNATFKNCK